MHAPRTSCRRPGPSVRHRVSARSASKANAGACGARSGGSDVGNASWRCRTARGDREGPALVVGDDFPRVSRLPSLWRAPGGDLRRAEGACSTLDRAHGCDEDPVPHLVRQGAPRRHRVGTQWIGCGHGPSTRALTPQSGTPAVHMWQLPYAPPQARWGASRTTVPARWRPRLLTLRGARGVPCEPCEGCSIKRATGAAPGTANSPHTTPQRRGPSDGWFHGGWGR